jgi:hypothetical protein
MEEIRDFYVNLLGLASPWAVRAVEAKEKSEGVDVDLECPETARFHCLHCNRLCSICDYSPPNTWRHLDTCRKMTYLHARLPVRGIVLCENWEHLKFIKRIDLIDVRRIMKQANPDLFEDFLERIVGG